MQTSILGLLSLAVVLGFAHGDMKPTKFAKEVVCEGCHAVIAEANKILGKGKRTDKQIDNAFRAICDVQRLNQYEFSPPTMKKVCDYWKDNYVSEVKDALRNGLPAEEQEIELCFVTTDICRGVDRSKFRINKYEGPSKRKVLAAVKAAKGEASEEEEEAEESPAEEKEDVQEVKKTKEEGKKKDSKKGKKEDKKDEL